MYLAAGIILLIVSIIIFCVIVLTAARSVKTRGELVISKKNLVYLAPTFMLIYFLHMSAWIYKGVELNFFNCFALLGSALEVITKFKVDTDMVLPICSAYPVYYAAFIFAYIAGAAAVILGVASFFSPRIRNFFSSRRALRRGCDIVVGDCADSLRYMDNNRGSLLYAPEITGSRYAELIKRGYRVSRASFKNLTKKPGEGEYNLILFGSADIGYSHVIDRFIEARRRGYKVTLNMEVNQSDIKIIKEKLVTGADEKKGVYINCFSKHELIARRFVVQYPITKFIPRSFYNENCTLRDDREINVVFVGFGKVNYQLFRMCSMQFQFAAQSGAKLVSKPVHYYIYDHSDAALHNEFFSRIVYEFDEDFRDCDFPPPERICDIAEVRQLDINSIEAKKKFKNLVTEDSFTYFVVSLTTDMEDASYAQTIKRLLPAGGNYRIFVRAKGNAEKLTEDGVIYFGGEDDIYTHDSIVNDELTELAIRINMLYDNVKNAPEWLKRVRALPRERQAEALNECLKDQSIRAAVRANWEERPMIEQTSNLCHALNLPFKLNLLGFDMVRRDGAGDGVTEEQFNEVYVNSGREEDYSDFNFYFKTQSSNVLAFIEHSRWNAMYILCDYTQMKKGDITAVQVTEGGKTQVKAVHKNAARKQHACITTYYGLKQLVEYEFSLACPGEDVSKVPCSDARLKGLYMIYAYDYMDLDRLYGEIVSLGYKVVKN